MVYRGSAVVPYRKQKLTVMITLNKSLCVLASALTLTLMVSCGNKTAQPGTTASTEQNAAPQAVMSIDELLASAEKNIGKEVTFKGICTHTCKHGAKKMFMMGSDDTKTIRVESGSLGSFDTRCINNLVQVTGIVEEQRIDEAYLQQWEESAKNQTMEQHGDGEAGCDSEKKARGETGNTVEERIADFRAQIAERKAKEGKDYLSFYYVTATAYQIED